MKVDKSTLTNGNGTEPGVLSIVSAQWSISGFSSVKLLFDHNTDDEALVLAPGNGYRDFSQQGGFPDPNSAGGTGDILLTTAGATASSTYDILLELLKGN